MTIAIYITDHTAVFLCSHRILIFIPFVVTFVVLGFVSVLVLLLVLFVVEEFGTDNCLCPRYPSYISHTLLLQYKLGMLALGLLLLFVTVLSSGNTLTKHLASKLLEADQNFHVLDLPHPVLPESQAV